VSESSKQTKKKMKLKISGDNPIVAYMDKDGLKIVLAIKNKEKLDVVKGENAILMRLAIPNDYIPSLMLMTAKRTLSLFLRTKQKTTKKAKYEKVDIDELFGKAEQITEEVEEEDLASLIK